MSAIKIVAILSYPLPNEGKNMDNESTRPTSMTISIAINDISVTYYEFFLKKENKINDKSCDDLQI